jgi:5'-nucleotidase (lipoprotein e(P4) family)
LKGSATSGNLVASANPGGQSMVTLKKAITCAVLVTLVAGIPACCPCRRAVTPPRETMRETHELLNAVLWVQTAVEYDFACREIYRLARLNLDEAMSDPGWTAALEQTGDYESLPPAVILDVDETTLDNTAFEAMLIRETEEYDKPLWYAWAREERAVPVPGALEFLQYAIDKGVSIFFVTNRDSAIEEPTVRNLQEEFGGWVTPENVLTRGEMDGWTSDKSSRRAFVAEGHRVLLLIGDDYNDFADLGESPPEERLTAARAHSDYWGTRWIILPNPMYGTWEQALYGYRRNLPDRMKLEAKYDRLLLQP